MKKYIVGMLMILFSQTADAYVVPQSATYSITVRNDSSVNYLITDAVRNRLAVPAHQQSKSTQFLMSNFPLTLYSSDQKDPDYRIEQGDQQDGKQSLAVTTMSTKNDKGATPRIVKDFSTFELDLPANARQASTLVIKVNDTQIQITN